MLPCRWSSFQDCYQGVWVSGAGESEADHHWEEYKPVILTAYLKCNAILMQKAISRYARKDSRVLHVPIACTKKRSIQWNILCRWNTCFRCGSKMVKCGNCWEVGMKVFLVVWGWESIVKVSNNWKASKAGLSHVARLSHKKWERIWWSTLTYWVGVVCW